MCVLNEKRCKIMMNTQRNQFNVITTNIKTKIAELNNKAPASNPGAQVSTAYHPDNLSIGGNKSRNMRRTRGGRRRTQNKKKQYRRSKKYR
jgi:hypothetical protein